MIHCVFSTCTEPFQHLKHSLDIWHKAKKLAFMLGEKAKKAPNKDHLPWIRPVVNHFGTVVVFRREAQRGCWKDGVEYFTILPTNTSGLEEGMWYMYMENSISCIILFYSQSEELSINLTCISLHFCRCHNATDPSSDTAPSGKWLCRNSSAFQELRTIMLAELGHAVLVW